MITGVFSMTDSNDFVKIVRFAQAILQRCSVPTNLDGFTYISEAVAFQLLHNPKRWHILYDLVAEKHDIPRHCVNRAINYLIHTHCEDVKVNFGLTDKTMSPSGIISSIALYIEHNYLNPVDISLDSDTDVDVAADVAATTD